MPSIQRRLNMAVKEKERNEKGLTDYGIIYLSGAVNEEKAS